MATVVRLNPVAVAISGTMNEPFCMMCCMMLLRTVPPTLRSDGQKRCSFVMYRVSFCYKFTIYSAERQIGCLKNRFHIPYV